MSIDDIVALFREEIPRRSSDVSHIWAVFWANFKIFLSYRMWVITETMSTIASISMYSFMGLQVTSSQIVSAGYGDVSWLSFALVGVSTANYLWMCISRISHAMQHEIEEGTLEPVISSLIRLRSYIIGQSIRGFFVSSYFMIGALVIGIFVLRVPLIMNAGTFVSFVIVIFMMILSYLGIGIMAAGLILVYKRGDPITFLFAGVTEFLGGVLFPLSYLKNYPVLWFLSWLMPYTYALDASRRILLTGATLISIEILSDILVLVAYSVIFIPVGLWFFRWGMNRIRDEGTVSTY